MNSALVDKKQLDEKGLFPHAEVLPDGRAIIPLNWLKAVTGLKDVEIADIKTVKKLQKIEVKQEEEHETGETVEEVPVEDQEFIPGEGKEAENE